MMIINKFTMLVLIGIIIVYPFSAAEAAMKLKMFPSSTLDVPQGGTVTVLLYDANNSCSSGSYTYWIDPPPIGTATINGDQVTYSNDGTNGYLTADKNAHKFRAYIKCMTDNKTDDKDLKPKDSSGGGGGGGGGGGSTTSGMVILDNTATPNTVAIGTNLIFYAGGNKSDTAIDDGIGGNAINITDFNILIRDTTSDPHSLHLYIGDDANVVDDANFGTDEQYDYFSTGSHLFDLNRLRATADWLAEDTNNDGSPDNITPDASVPYGTYGSISLPQFLDNIANGHTMYGMVRVKIPLELRSSATGTKTNALGELVNANTLYGFCSSTAGSCSCAPSKNTSTNFFSKIIENATTCGINLPASAKIKVKGTLLWDFVDNVSGAALSLGQLPYVPRELYFKVEIPIMTNWSYDLDDDGAMDNMAYIKSMSNGITGTNPIDITAMAPVNAIDFTRIPQSSRDQYAFEIGNPLDASTFALLNRPTQYHLLMANGYPDGWAEAFDKLNLSAPDWSALPPDSCTTEGGSSCKKFNVPSGVTGIMVANDIRSDEFEDIPSYMYSGGLIDMHDHVSIAGLLYVPQGMELEAKDSSIPTQQYLYGGMVVRDSFYIAAKDNTITVISAGPDTYSTAITTQSSYATNAGPALSNLTYGSNSSTGSSSSSSSSSSTVCIGCGTSSSSSSSGAAGKVRWVEIHPNN